MSIIFGDDDVGSTPMPDDLAHAREGTEPVTQGDGAKPNTYQYLRAKVMVASAATQLLQAARVLPEPQRSRVLGAVSSLPSLD